MESRADLFGSEEGAAEDLEALRGQLDAEGQVEEAPELGEEAVAGSSLQGSGKGAFRYVTVGWRDRNVVATLLAAGLARGFRVADALALARKQQRRIAGA